MKIYNDVVYQIVDDKLVKVSEDSFDYEGELVLCGPLGAATANRSGGTVGKMRTKWNNATEKVLPGVQKLYGDNAGRPGEYFTNMARNNNLDKPGGTVKTMTDVVKDWSGKSEKIAWGTDSTETDEEEVVVDTDTPVSDPDVFAAGDSDASANLKANRKKQALMRGRNAANQTQGQSASLITAQ